MAEIMRYRSSPDAQVDMTLFTRHPFVDTVPGIQELEDDTPAPPSSSPATPLKSVLKRRASDSSLTSNLRDRYLLKRAKTVATPPSLGHNSNSNAKHRSLLWGASSAESQRIRYGMGAFRRGDITLERRVRFRLDQGDVGGAVTTPTRSGRTDVTIKLGQKNSTPALSINASDELADLRVRCERLSRASSKKDETIRALQKDLATMKDRVDSLEAKAIESKRDNYRSRINTTKLEEKVSGLEKKSKAAQLEVRAVMESAKQEIRRHGACVDAKLTSFMEELRGQFQAFDKHLSSRYLQMQDKGRRQDVMHSGTEGTRECSIVSVGQELNPSVA